MAVNMARSAESGPAMVVAVHVVPIGAQNGDLVRAEQAFAEALVEMDYEQIEKRIVEGKDIVEAVLHEAQANDDQPGSDLIVVGATQEPLMKNLLMGSIPEQIANRAAVPVIMVKRRSSPLHSFLHKTVLSPSTRTVVSDNPTK
jgi:nucleotide-binding universal stress UspA family protein